MGISTPNTSWRERFWSKVQKGEGCWEWRAAKSPRGYGRFSADGKTVRATHASWVLHHNAPLPDGLIIRHTCDNPSCVRPDHLLSGTHWDNAQDKMQRKRCACGSKHGMSKLTEHDILHIRQARGTSREIASVYGVDQKSILRIKWRETWQHVPDALAA